MWSIFLIIGLHYIFIIRISFRPIRIIAYFHKTRRCS